ncbi:contact-dependent growth inhibition system immunity protein, partial [Proteus myxofaciens]|uniref:contact-dependent growth inhibition system immunity protein n=1 Tax=Proteus myxofaciens TaxID=184072 RepID=UPI00082A72EC
MFTLNNNELRVNVYFNGDYYIVVTLSDIGIFFMDFKKGYNIFNKNINNIYLGFHTKKALIKSEKIDTKLTEVIELQDDKKYYSDWVKKVIKECGYKNKTALFENMDVCAITAIDDKIS